MDAIPEEIIILIIGEIRDYTNFSNFRSTCKRIRSICDHCQYHKRNLFVKEGPTNFLIQFKALLQRLLPGPYRNHNCRIPGEFVKWHRFSRDACFLEFLRRFCAEMISAVKGCVEHKLGKGIDPEEMKSHVSITAVCLEEVPDTDQYTLYLHFKFLNPT